MHRSGLRAFRWCGEAEGALSSGRVEARFQPAAVRKGATPITGRLTPRSRSPAATSLCTPASVPDAVITARVASAALSRDGNAGPQTARGIGQEARGGLRLPRSVCCSYGGLRRSSARTIEMASKLPRRHSGLRRSGPGPGRQQPGRARSSTGRAASFPLFGALGDTWWLRRESLFLGSEPRRAARATASFRAAEAALWGAEKRPKPLEPPGGQVGRCRQTG